ncbi:class II aldolase/adducin family protein [Hippea maritima]|uniref:Class II aldolase/adducin family protein n=1 Tax=Hippea maritima (strain ATCC 700847 / DSM 10411 / MH2) TaxID=760142 RepID=F2LUD9_HIPMA|nr:class II aldolase/adducin family protein [Hippea maritima]AEA33465.1 class II aldolase/adducin family protein [Hippea maritima DSM 10411]
MIGEFRRIGNMMFLSGLVDASSGNMSFKAKDGVWITKTGKSLYNLRGKDIVKIGFERDVRWNAASSEVEIHINIYKLNKKSKAILHAHSISTIILSLKGYKTIEPIDYEGSLFLKSVDILDIPYNNWQTAKEIIPQYLKETQKQIVVAKGHGVFAYSDTLFGALQLISALENSSKIILGVEGD